MESSESVKTAAPAIFVCPDDLLWLICDLESLSLSLSRVSAALSALCLPLSCAMDRMQRMFQQAAAGGPPVDHAVADTAETVHISSLALLKMLKHGRAGVPMEVMGLMVGEFVDEYSISVIDVFAMPQSGTGVSVEAIDPVFQTKMLDMLKQTNRPQMVVGWYHSHPGFGPWLSGVDINVRRQN